MGIALTRFSELISEINAAAIRPEEWQRALRAVAAAVGAREAGLTVTRAQRTRMTACTSERMRDSYNERFRQFDPMVAVLESAPPATVVGWDAVVTPQARRRHVFFTDWAGPHRLGNAVFARLATGTSWIGVYAGPGETLDRAGTAETLSLLLPHIEHALGVQARLTEAVTDRDAARGVLDRHRHGLALVSACGRVEYANPAARRLLRAGDGLRLGPETRLELSDRSIACRFRALLISILRDRHPEGGGRLLVPRRSGRDPLTLSLLPIDPDAASGTHRLALLVIVDPGDAEPATRDTLRDLYGLTRAEATVAYGVMRGTGLAAVAGDLFISVNTARTHLRQVFAKTGTNRQAELVRLLSCQLAGSGQFAGATS